MEGWIKLHRKLLDSTIFTNPNLLKFWIWCLLKASHKDRRERVGLQEIDIKKGQFIFGRNKASLELRVTTSTAYKYLKRMESEHLIELKSNNKFTVVTIVNWASYQSEDEKSSNKVATKEQQSNNKRTTKEQQSNTNKNVKNVKNDKNKKIYGQKFDEFWKSYPRKIDKGNAYKKFQARVNEGYAEEELIECAKQYAKKCKAESTEPKYIKHAKTFLSDTRPFLDFLERGEDDQARGEDAEIDKYDERTKRAIALINQSKA